MNIAVLIGIMIAVVIGVNLIPTAVSVAEEGEASGLAGILMIVFVTVIILGATAWIGFSSEKTSGGETSNKIVAAIKSYVKEHKKRCLTVLIVGAVILLLQLSTYI